VLIINLVNDPLPVSDFTDPQFPSLLCNSRNCDMKIGYAKRIGTAKNQKRENEVECGTPCTPPRFTLCFLTVGVLPIQYGGRL
jgi:hypothetical protein